jgi:hypothetical protein
MTTREIVGRRGDCTAQDFPQVADIIDASKPGGVLAIDDAGQPVSIFGGLATAAAEHMARAALSPACTTGRGCWNTGAPYPRAARNLGDRGHQRDGGGVRPGDVIADAAPSFAQSFGAGLGSWVSGMLYQLKGSYVASFALVMCGV